MGKVGGMMKRVKAKTKTLKQQLQHAAKQAKGAYKTVHNRQIIMARVGQYLKDNNIQISHIDQIKVKYIEGYIQTRQQHISKRTLQNEMAAIRQTLKVVGREKLVANPRLSNQALGINGASRQGTKVAITEQEYQTIHQQALNQCPAIAATLDLAKIFGLRSEEAVQSSQSLKTWQMALEKGKKHIHVIFGTKGGRPRDVYIIDPQKALQVINNALVIIHQQSGKLINKPNLKQAMTYWRNQTCRLGLTGKISPHSLRYAFAQQQIQYYLQ